MNGTRRYNQYHGGAKGTVVAPQVRPAPAWQTRNMPTAANGRPVNGQGTSSGEGGSKVLLSNFPQDVEDREIIDLMRKTVGPIDLRNTIMFTDERNVPLGMGVISFTRNNDAVRARRMYNGKIIDGKRTIKLELVFDYEPNAAPSMFTPKEVTQPKPKLINRMAKAGPNGVAPMLTSVAAGAKPQARLGNHVVSPSSSAGTISAGRRRTKKGPKRVRKVVTKVDLDAEMDAYRVNSSTLAGA